MFTCIDLKIWEGWQSSYEVSKSLLLMDLWERKLRVADAIGWIDEHCEFTRVPRGKWMLKEWDKWSKATLENINATGSDAPLVKPP
jgi:hypothetical protein